MKTYLVTPETRGSGWKIHSWNVKQKGIFGPRKLADFTDRQEAVEYVKSLGDKNRPSHIKIYDVKGDMVYSWSYPERPRVYK